MADAAVEAQETGSAGEESSQLMLPLSRGNKTMTADQANEPAQHDAAAAEAETNRQTGDAVAEFFDDGNASLGQRLCAARERRGWSRLEVGAQLKLPVSLIARLENDNYEGLSQGVFLRGYLNSYARLVGIPVGEAAQVAEASIEIAPLVATGTISRSRYLFERYSVSATYLVLTAIIVVPAVWLATHGGLEQNLARTTPLDPPITISTPPQHDSAATASDSVAATTGESAVEPASGSNPASGLAMPQPESPIIASMTPFTTSRQPVAEPVPEPKPASSSTATVGSGAHSLVLKLAQQSWVEVTAADGSKLEYSMLPAGSEHSYRSDGVLSVRLGNVQGAQVITDGTVVDLTPFQRGNVAHVNVFGSGSSGVSRAEQ